MVFLSAQSININTNEAEEEQTERTMPVIKDVFVFMLIADNTARENRFAVIASGLAYIKIKKEDSRVLPATESHVLLKSNALLRIISIVTIAALSKRKFIPADCL